MNFMRLISLFPMLLILTGCASGYSKFYTQRIDETSFNNLVTLKDDQTPIIVKTNNLNQEVERYYAKNYLVIGESSFNGAMESDANFISQAKDVKATLVLQTSKFLTAQGISTPLIMPNGLGGFNTSAMYSQQMRYDQAAVYMAKSTKKMRVGVACEDLTPEQKKQYERNNGAVVRIVYEESPAFDANIVPGDLIISIDGNTVRGEEHAGQMLDAIPQSTDKITFKVIRNNIEKDIVVLLGKS